MKRLILFLLGTTLGIGVCLFFFRWLAHKNIEIEIPELALNNLLLGKTENTHFLPLKFRIHSQCELGVMDLLEMDWHDSKSSPLSLSLESLEDDSFREVVPITMQGLREEQKIFTKSVVRLNSKAVGLFLCAGGESKTPCRYKKSLSPTNGIVENLQLAKRVSDRRYLFFPLVLDTQAQVHFLNVANLHDSQLPSLRTKLSQLLKFDSESRRANQLLDRLKSTMSEVNLIPLDIEDGRLIIRLGKHDTGLCHSD